MKALASAMIVLMICAFAVSPARACRNQAPSSPSTFVLQVRFEKGPPSYMALAAAGSKSKGAIFSRFGRLVSWKAPQGSPSVTAVRVVPVAEGTGARVAISVLLGPNHDTEKIIADYMVQPNETVATAKLAGFGVEPFELKLIKAPDPSSLAIPAITNNTLSIVSDGVRPDESLLATYIVTVRNNSPRRVMALNISLTLGPNAGPDADPIPVKPQGIEGRPLIEPGAKYEFRAAGGQRGKEVAVDPDSVPPAPSSISINGVVFDDGTYEGDGKAAADYLSIQAGCWWQLKKVTALLAAANAPGADLAALKTRVLGLGDVPTRDEIREIPARYVFPDPEVQFDAVGDFKFGAHRVKEMLVMDIIAFEKAHPSQDKAAASSDDVAAWLAKATARYSGWYSRM